MTTNEPPPYPGDPGPSTSGLPSYGSVPPPPGGFPPPPSGGFPPPPPGGGYAPPSGDPFAYSPTEAIGYGWRKFRENAGQLVLAVLILVVAGLALAGLSEVIAPAPDYVTSSGDFSFDAGATLASLIAQTVTGTVGYIFTAMLIRGALDIVGDRGSTSDERSATCRSARSW